MCWSTFPERTAWLRPSPGRYLGRVRCLPGKLARCLASAGAALLLTLDFLESCPKCYESTPARSLDAYVASALTLSALPLVMGAAVLYTIWRQLRGRARAADHPGEQEPR